MFEAAIAKLQALEEFAQVTNDQPLGEIIRYEHSDGRVVFCAPFRFQGYLYVVFFMNQGIEDSLDQVCEFTGVKPGPETFAVKFCRADVSDLSPGELFDPVATRRLGGALRPSSIDAFLDRLCDVVELHMSIYTVHGYIFIPAHHALNRIYRRVLSSERVSAAGLVRISERDEPEGMLGYFLVTPEYFDLPESVVA
jgi:hypothetical protein